jgi:hypothetical protein
MITVKGLPPEAQKFKKKVEKYLRKFGPLVSFEITENGTGNPNPKQRGTEFMGKH